MDDCRHFCGEQFVIFTNKTVRTILPNDWKRIDSCFDNYDSVTSSYNRDKVPFEVKSMSLWTKKKQFFFWRKNQRCSQMCFNFYPKMREREKKCWTEENNTTMHAYGHFSFYRFLFLAACLSAYLAAWKGFLWWLLLVLQQSRYHRFLSFYI